MPYTAKHITVTINRPAQQVYDFAANPLNFPQWAAGLAPTIRQAGDIWIIDTPEGEIKVRFAEPNTFGVIDHDVTLPSGETSHNPMRAVPNGDGCEFTFTLYRMPDATDEAFARDAAAVQRDLDTLKSILESAE